MTAAREGRVDETLAERRPPGVRQVPELVAPLGICNEWELRGSSPDSCPEELLADEWSTREGVSSRMAVRLGGWRTPAFHFYHAVVRTSAIRCPRHVGCHQMIIKSGCSSTDA